MSLKAFLPSLLVLALSACAVGPDYQTPNTEAANITAATDGAAGQKNFDRSRFEGIWWQQFEDPTLNQLVTQSLKGNRDLRVAFARWKAARAIRDDISNDNLPVVTSRVSSDLGKGQIPGQTTDRVNSERYDLGLDMAWEIDLFGRIQRNLESANAEQQSLEADLYQLQVSMIAELVDAYGQLRGAQLREKIALANLENQQESRKITINLRDAGVGDQLDVERADARLASVEASVPQLQAEQVREKNRIATLLGERPDKLTVDLSPKDLPAIAKALPIGNPGELLQRRPDIRSAERKLASATARIGVAKADLFPQVSLSGFLGFTAGRGSQIGSSAANAWALGPSITWAAFDLGSVRARLRAADADAEGALATYEQQVLLALEESENAFSDYGKRQQRLISLIRQSESSRSAADLAEIRYREGTADFLVLLDAQRERLAAEDTQAQAEVDLYRGIVAIYKALGGGWQPETVASN
ncbi:MULTISPECIES: efflux transporter outer membrane subunit [Pseudomonas]|uniref:efflux transporter outer membrane subunit n=1 Tax=Pseudomonas TaxID=286 RepID=UPI00027001C5|nr:MULTISPECIES: TolC family protein [Pseudomonas]MDP9653296.1 multidrug efflux system outer membrane protein [Pseudomonas putida]EJM48655.1 efflux transporter, outer membrane factor lipoprotein, NodT family [Pseudomonas sp. GM33]MBV7554042.1 TolC family protein [Pseudomonas sp. PDM28]PVZ52655.1 TolC family protein [Pseudomonas sp. B1(2018)]UVM07870.1 TolC family protein [Pseudomonas laurylsulfatiphila]